jgi:hypothetical protein
MAISQKRLWQLILLGYLHWFFSNFYELMVFTPNVIFSDSISSSIKLIQQFWSVTQPPWYFLPWNPLTIFFTWVLILRGWANYSSDAKPYIKALLISSIAITAVTAYIIINVNTKFYFDEIRLSETDVIYYFHIGLWLGNLRILLELLIIFLITMIIRKRYFVYKIKATPVK